MARPSVKLVLVSSLTTLIAFLALIPGVGALGRDTYTPLVLSTFSTPRWFHGTDGRFHLVYELTMTNGFPTPVTVSSVTVRDRQGGRKLEQLQGSELEASMSLLASPTEPTLTVPPSSVGVVWIDVALRSRRQIPRAITHSVTVGIPPGLPVPETIRESGGAAQVDQRPPLIIAPPLRGPNWIAVGSCCDGPHRRSVQPVNGGLHLGQRFAIDWNGMDDQHRFVVGDPKVNANWTFYGKPVLAVADARVVKAVDRYPDQIPLESKPVTIEEADGNYVILALGHHRFAFYAHLEPGSITVKPGDRVAAGQVIGRLGNSGSSTGPHLHFQIMNRPSALASNGLPFGFARQRYAGRIPALDPSLEMTVNAGGAIPVDPSGAGPRRAAMPMGRDVIDFPQQPR